MTAQDNTRVVILFDDSESRDHSRIEEMTRRYEGRFIMARHFAGTVKFRLFIEPLLASDPVIFYHAGLRDKGSDNGHEVLASLEQCIAAHGLRYIRFSGAIAVESTTGKGRDMQRSAFYARLPQLVDEALTSGAGTDAAPDAAPDPQPSASSQAAADCPDAPDEPCGPVIYNGATEANLYEAMKLRICVDSNSITDEALRPIVFVDPRTIHEIISADYAGGARQRYSGILVTDGVYLVASEADIPQAPQPLARDNYRIGFLNRIRLLPLDESDNHTIANDWGAYVIERMLNRRGTSSRAADRIRERDLLYMRYLQRTSASESGEAEASTKVKVVPYSKKCNILLIDDQDDIWKPVLTSLFPNARIDVIGRSHLSPADTPSPFIRDEKDVALLNGTGIDAYDIVICDLRLGGHYEEDVDPAELSGMKVLEMIHANNPAQHVVMFTSSNKAWNMRKALADYGCLGYYIKESPMYPKKPEESARSVETLLGLVAKAQQWHWLVTCYRDKQELLDLAEEFAVRNDEDGYDETAADLREISTQIDLSFRMLRAAMLSDDRTLTAYAYVALEQVFEIIKKWNVDSDDLSYGTFNLLRGLFPDISDEIKKHISARNSFIHKNGTGDFDPYDPQSYRNLFYEIRGLLLSPSFRACVAPPTAPK